MLDDSFVTDEEINSIIIDNSHYPSLLHLPTELILHIIRILPQSPYHKCLNVCKRLNAIENRYIKERCAMCLCRLYNHSPNLPSHELKLRVCMHTGQHQLDVLLRMIKRRPLTCKIQITGEKIHVERLKDYLERHNDHPNVEIFLKNFGSNIVYLSRFDLWNTSIDLSDENINHFNTEFTTLNLLLTLRNNEDFNRRFVNILSGSCFAIVSIDCNNMNLYSFNQCLKNYCHIFDAMNFQKKVNTLHIDLVASTSIQIDLLNDFQNISELTFAINEDDLENIKNRILELITLLKQTNFKQLYVFKLYENSPVEYSTALTQIWADLLAVIPSKNLQRLEIIKKTNPLIKQVELSNNLLLSFDITRFQRLQFLTIHHFGFDSSLLKILLPQSRLTNLDLRINIDMDMSKNNELCHNIENCKSLQEIGVYIYTEAIIMLTNIFNSLAKLKRLTTISLRFESFEGILQDECYQNLELIKTLRKIFICIQKGEFNGANTYNKADEQLKKKIATFVSKECRIYIRYR